MTSSTKILIVDDDRRMVESLAILLANEGYTIHTAHGGRAAIRRLQEEEFDLILLDVVMPDMDGYDIMEFVRQQCPESAVVVMTGFASADSAIGAFRKGASDYLRKPFEYEELVWTIQNTLDRKKLRDETRFLNGMLKWSEKRYEYLVENSPDIIYSLDEKGRFTFVNSAAERLLGFRKEDLIGTPFREIVWDEDWEKAERLCSLSDSEKPPVEGGKIRLRSLQKETEPRYFEIRCMKVRQEKAWNKDNSHSAGAVSLWGIHGIARDISYREQLEAQLHQAQKMESIGTLAGGLAHNFNNILMAIQGNLSLLSLDLDSDLPCFERIRNIEEQVKSASELTRQLLDLARQKKPKMAAADLNEVVRKSCRMFGSTKKDVVIHETYAPDLDFVEMDVGQIEQVLLNLYLNAWQAMPGGGSLYVETRNVILEREDEVIGLSPGRYVLLTIRDTGSGMDEATLQRIFEPFFTTKRATRSTGLGLTSVYRIIQNHSGSIKVSSRKGEGTTFRIYLPASEKKERAVEPLAARVVKGSETVLLIDDEEMVLRAGEEMLQALGYRVIPAGSGEEGVQLYERYGPEIDIVVLDMIMPGMNGSEAFRLLKRIDPDVKVLIASGGVGDEAMDHLFEEGCGGFIQKPFDLSFFSQKLREILEGK